MSERCVVDLGVEHIIQSICLNFDYYANIKKLFSNLCNDPEVISYRHDILEDLDDLPELCSEIESIIPDIRKLENFTNPKYVTGAESLRKIAWQLEMLELYAKCISKLYAAFQKRQNQMKSAGMRKLFQFIEELAQSDDYRSMVAEIPELRSQLQSISSITIGINLDNELRPAEAIFLSVEPRPFKEKKRSFVSSILGIKSVDEEYKGISQFQNILKDGNSPLESALFKNLEDVFSAALLPIGAALGRYIHINVRKITSLQFEFLYYLGAIKLYTKLRSVGLIMCKPKVAPADERVFKVEQLTDFILSVNLNRQHPGIPLNNTIVDNDVEFGSAGRVFILTGPNQGGKTTYTRAIGVAQLLFQAGLYVPGSYACISPVDWIFTHFSEEEQPNTNHGRLGEESRKLSQIFEHATGQSLILLNESLSSTSPSDSLYLARDLIKGIKLLECRAVFATHLLELAASVDVINEQWESDSKLISMVAGVLHAGELKNPVTKRTYKVTQGPPMEMSYARDIAYLHGISFEQIVDRLKDRHLINR